MRRLATLASIAAMLAITLAATTTTEAAKNVATKAIGTNYSMVAQQTTAEAPDDAAFQVNNAAAIIEEAIQNGAVEFDNALAAIEEANAATANPKSAQQSTMEARHNAAVIVAAAAPNPIATVPAARCLNAAPTC